MPIMRLDLRMFARRTRAAPAISSPYPKRLGISSVSAACLYQEPRLPHGNFAGEEAGLVASSTNITKASKSVEPLLETCMGTSAP